MLHLANRENGCTKSVVRPGVSESRMKFSVSAPDGEAIYFTSQSPTSLVLSVAIILRCRKSQRWFASLCASSNHTNKQLNNLIPPEKD